MPTALKPSPDFLNGFRKITSRGPLVGKVYQILKEAIICGKLPPGAWLPEAPLTKALGISRTPLREAINRLESEGFIQVWPRKGAQVVELTEEEIQDLFEAREAIEINFFSRAAQRFELEELKAFRRQFEKAEQEWEAARGESVRWEKGRQAYLRVDRAFHDRLILLAGNDCWRKLYDNIRDKIELYGYVLTLMPEKFNRARREHYAIIDAILSKEFVKGRRLMQKHIRHVQSSVLAYRRMETFKGRRL